MKASEAKRLRELEAENARLKKLVANQALDIDLLKELAGKLLTPERRRRAVEVLQCRFGVSERRACRVAGQHHATQRRSRPRRPDNEARLRQRLRVLARAHPRWGWRMAWRVLRREPGQPWTGVNHKRIHRLWREEGLRRPIRTRKRRRLAPETSERLRAQRPMTCGRSISSSTRHPMAGG
jgi:hypothetical protein